MRVHSSALVLACFCVVEHSAAFLSIPALFRSTASIKSFDSMRLRGCGTTSCTKMNAAAPPPPKTGTQTVKRELRDEALSRFFVGPVTCTPTSGGVNNMVNYVETMTGEKYILRIYNNGKNSARVKFEHEILRQLGEMKLSFEIPKTLPSLEDKKPHVLLSNGAEACIFHIIPGSLPKTASPRYPHLPIRTTFPRTSRKRSAAATKPAKSARPAQIHARPGLPSRGAGNREIGRAAGELNSALGAVKWVPRRGASTHPRARSRASSFSRARPHSRTGAREQARLQRLAHRIQNYVGTCTLCRERAECACMPLDGVASCRTHRVRVPHKAFTCSPSRAVTNPVPLLPAHPLPNPPSPPPSPLHSSPSFPLSRLPSPKIGSPTRTAGSDLRLEPLTRISDSNR